MQFTHILFLMASVAIAGPLLAHLLNRSKFRRVPFTMLQFLHMSQKQTQSKRRLRDFLILLLRCAIILLIAILFAGPVIYRQVQQETARHYHFLVLDDSLSMSCKDGDQSGFDQMIEELKSYLQNNKGPQSVFHLYSVTGGCMAKDLTAEAAIFSIDDMKISYGQVDLMGLWADLKQIRNNKGRADTINVHIISDFTDDVVKAFRHQPGGVDIGRFSFSIIGEDQNPNNLAITNASVIHLEKGRLTLSATVANYGNEKSKRLIRAGVDGIYSNEIIVNPAPNAVENVVLTMDISPISNKKGFLPIELKLTPEDDLAADDMYPIAVAMEVGSKQRILLAGYDSDELFLMYTALKTLQESANTCIESIDMATYSQFKPERLASYDIVISSTVARSFQGCTHQIQKYIENGGRWVFFSDNRVHGETAKTLYQTNVLPVMIQHDMAEVRHLGKLEKNGSGAESSDRRMLSVLEQYQVEKIGLWAYYQCVQCPEALCLWQIDSMASLVYQRPVKGGSCTFINTSIDDSRSALTKNAAVLPLIQYLLGHSEHISEYHFACNEIVRFPLMEKNESKEVDYLDGQDEKNTAQVNGAFIQIPAPHHCGWIRALTEPVCYAGVHAINGETNLNRSYSGQIEKILAGIFQGQSDAMVAQAGSGLSRESRGLDKILVWLIIFLILTDCFVANRMQRS